MAGSSGRRRRRLWRFGEYEFDEAGWSLRVGGKVAPLEGKPLEVLHELLLRAGEVVTKEELFDAVWPGVVVVEGSLTTAVSKLRRALGPGGEAIVVTAPKVGYRLAGPVSVESIEAPLTPRFAFTPGQAAPGRAQWVLERPLGDTGAADVWLARHGKTGEARVFKFADAPDRLRGLKREATLSRLLAAALGRAAPIPALLEWNFDGSPYFLEYAYGGEDLTDWARSEGGLAAIPLARRLAVAARLARALDAVHRLGVLHKDLKPANVLIETDEAGEPVVRLVDFGSGRLLDDAVLGVFRITDPGVAAEEQAGADSRSGTLAYRAPELAQGSVSTVRSDVFALGLILYQLIVGDFDSALAPGWEERIADPLLVEDVRRAAEVDPERRLASAGELADRLEALDARRAAAARAAEEAAFLASQQQADERRAARRPWAIAAVFSLAAGLATATGLALYAGQQRDQAVEARDLAEASYRFLAEDLLGGVDPARAAAAEETLVQAIDRTGGSIASRFGDRPMVAGYLYATLARAFDLRSDYDQAFRYYELALASYRKAGVLDAPAGLNVRLQYAAALALSTREGAGEKARAMVAEAEADIARGRVTDPETRVWLDSAKGMIALAGGDVPVAKDRFSAAYEGASALPSVFSPRQQANFGQRYAFTLLRMGDGPAAERTFRDILGRLTRLVGPEHPDTLLLRLNVGQALMVQHRDQEAVDHLTPLLPLLERRLGRDHRHTLLLLAARQQSLGALGRYDEAAQDGERIWRTAAAKDGPGSFAAVAGRMDTGISQCRAGRLAEGEANLRAAIAAQGRPGGARTPLEDGGRAGLADCLILAGRHDEAAAQLDGIDRVKVGQLVGDADWGAQVDLALAEIALARGDEAEARRRLSAARGPLAKSRDLFVRRRLAKLEARLGR